MRSPKLFACLLALCALGLGGCGRRTEVKMIDPRTGAVAFCASGQYSGSAQPEALYPLQACLNELAYYGFRDEDWLRRVSQPPRVAQGLPQPLPWLPPAGQRGPSPSAYAQPVYSGPVSPAY